MEALENDLLEHDGLFVEEGLFSDEIIITVKGCNDGDYYVALDGDDAGVGSRDDPFKTVEHAFSVVEPNEIIVLVDDEYHISETIIVPCSCTLVSCAEDYSTLLPAQSTVFQVEQDVQFTMIGVGMKYKCCELFSENTVFWNNNPTNNPVNIALNRPVGCKPLTEILLEDIEDINAGENITIAGSIVQIDRRTEAETPLNNATVQIYLNNVKLSDLTSNNNGEISNTYLMDTADDYTLQVVYEENESYCGSTDETTFQVYHNTYLTVYDDGTVSYTTSHETLEIDLDEENSDLTMTYDDNEDNMDISIDENGDIIVEDNYCD